MTYRGRDSVKDIASRLGDTEPTVKMAVDQIASVEKRVEQVAEQVAQPEPDVGDLRVYFRNALL